MTRRPFYIVVLFTALYMLPCMLAMAQQYNFRNWTLEQGLPQSQVNAIIQDKAGYLWLATRGGVSRFNGKHFYTYTDETGLGSNNITALFEDKRKNIWIGSSDHGVALFNGSKLVRLGKEHGITANTIYDITEDQNGKVWLATEGGLFIYADGVFQKYTELPEQPYHAVEITPSNEVWAGSHDGLHHITSSGIHHYTTENSALPSNHITTLYQQRNNTLWIGTEGGAAKITNSNIHPFDLPINKPDLAVSSFLVDIYGNLWVGLKRNGLIKFDGKTYTHFNRQNGLRSKRVISLASDREGNIWIGTNGYGLQQYTSPWFVHYFDFTEISEPRITSLTKDSKGRVWVGTEEGTTAYLEGSRLNWNLKPVWQEGTTVHGITVYNNQCTWVATSNGAWEISPKGTRHFTMQDGLPADEVYQCLPDDKGDVWLATANGVACYTANGFKKFTMPSLLSVNRIHHLHLDSRNQLWIAASSGVYKLVNGKVIKAPELEELQLEEVTSIAEDKYGNLYFGGFNYGIAVLNTKWGRPKLFTRADGLPNEGIKGLYIDSHDNLWAGTSRNVLKVLLPKLREHQQLSFRSYFGANGFRGIEINNNAITETPDGHIWFGTTKGLTQYLPHLDRRNKVYPTLVLNEILLFQKPTDWRQLGFNPDSVTGLPKNPKLSHSQNHLTFSFHGICLSGPEQVRYKYRLKGYQDQWSLPTDQAFASYPNLDPGNYTFELLAQNNDGFWTPKPLVYTFSIVPPIWRREWFIGVLLLVVAGAVLGIVKLRERSLVNMNMLLEMRVNHRTRQLERKNREKEMLLQEIHHRVKNNLQIVISMLNLQARYVQDPQATDVMRALKSRVRSMAILHERLYRHDDIGEIDLEDYFRGICESLYEAYGTTMEQVQLDLRVPPIKVNIDTAITLGLIVNELVSNSLKYAFPVPNHRPAVLRVVLEQDPNGHYTLTVSDNGKGLPVDFCQKMKSSFGLQLVSSLSKKINGKIEFHNINGTNSILSFVLPP